MSISTVRLSALLILTLACGDLEADDDDARTDGPASVLDASVATGAASEAGVARVRELDASDNMLFVYFDLESGEVRTLAKPADWSAWDLKVQRFKLATNGGASGGGSVQVAPLEGANFDALAQAPRQGYAADGPDGADPDLEPDYVLSNGTSSWYAYDGTTHALSPRPLVFVVRSQEGQFFKLAIDGYYNAAGSPGHLQLRWAPIAPPDGPIVTRQTGDGGMDAVSSASTR